MTGAPRASAAPLQPQILVVEPPAPAPSPAAAESGLRRASLLGPGLRGTSSALPQSWQQQEQQQVATGGGADVSRLSSKQQQPPQQQASPAHSGLGVRHSKSFGGHLAQVMQACMLAFAATGRARACLPVCVRNY